MIGNASQSEVEFEVARKAVLGAQFRSELYVKETAAPERIAPHSVALAAGISHPRAKRSLSSEAGAGRFVLLYNPVAQAEWNGNYRVICYAQAPLEKEIGADPFIAEVAWSWLTESLDVYKAEYSHIAGTATSTISTGFGSLEQQGIGTQLELRASWSPAPRHFDSHVKAWANLLCLLAGFPSEEGVASIDLQRSIKKNHTTNAK